MSKHYFCKEEGHPLRKQLSRQNKYLWNFWCSLNVSLHKKEPWPIFTRRIWSYEYGKIPHLCSPLWTTFTALKLVILQMQRIRSNNIPWLYDFIILKKYKLVLFIKNSLRSSNMIASYDDETFLLRNFGGTAPHIAECALEGTYSGLKGGGQNECLRTAGTIFGIHDHTSPAHCIKNGTYIFHDNSFLWIKGKSSNKLYWFEIVYINIDLKEI